MEEIYNLLLSTIGLSFKDGKLYDEDTGMFLLYKKKYIVEQPELVMRSNNAVVFDPIMNKGLMQYLFNVYIDKETADGNIYLATYQVIFETPSQDRSIISRRKLLMIGGNGSQASTRYYYLETLVYIEAVFVLTGMNFLQLPDLEPFDNKDLLVVK